MNARVPRPWSARLGRMFVVLATGILIVPVTGSALHPGRAMATAALPSNGRIVFAHFRDSNYSWDIRSIEPDGTANTWLSEDRARYEVGPQVSPDGTKIAYEFDYDVLVMNIDGSNRRLLTNDGSAKQDWNIRWSPDGTTLAFLSDRTGDTQLFTVPVAGGSMSRVSQGLTSVGYDGYSWAPDSSRLTFAGWDASLGKTDLYTATPDGSVVDRVSTTDDYPIAPDWSPDGLSIVYIHNGQVWSIHPDGSTKTQLSTGLTKYLAEWSPAGDQILYLELGTVDSRALGVMDANGQNPVSLVGGTVVANPSWSPDGTEIVFRGVQDRKEGEIYTISASGGTPTRLTFDHKDDRTPDWAPGCTITGTAGADVLRGTSGSDLICGGAGDDVIYGLGGNDVLLGGPGNDKVLGGHGDDVLAGESGVDRLAGGGGNDTVNGLDKLIGDHLSGGAGMDRCRKDGGDIIVSCETIEQPL